MSIEEMNLEEINARLAQLEVEYREMDEEALEKAAEEKTLLKTRKAELEEIEARTKAAEDLTDGKAVEEKVVEKTEENKENRTMDINSIEYRNAWLKKLQGAELTEVEERAYASTDSNNAIPTLVADKFFEKIKKIAPMLDEITLMQVPGNLKFVVEGTNNAAASHTENATINGANDTIVSVTLGAVEFAKVIYISKTASAQSVDAFESWLVELLSRDIARAVDNYIINGGSDGVADIVWTSNTNQILQTATTGYSYTDIMNLIALLPAGYDGNAKFLCHKATFMAIKGIVDSNKRPIFDPSARELCGYPVLVDDYVTTANKALYLGDFKQVVGNFSIPVEVESWSAHDKGAIGYRGLCAFDSKVANKEAFVRLVTTA